jgi:hypothetical protein
MAWLFCAQAMQVLKGRGASFFFFYPWFQPSYVFFGENSSVYEFI